MNDKTDLLRFSAYSLKELITRKLSEDTKFTDQVYEGSNLSILIDIISYMFQCITYLLNTSAAESMFSDTQIYENINRLVKLIGYNPKGIVPASALFYLDNKVINENGEETGGKYRNYLILKYSAIDIGKTDSNGNAVYYSLNESKNITDDLNYEIQLVNGRWKYYGKLEASGLPYETFVLDDLKSDTENKKFVANNGIDVYIERKLGSKTVFMKYDVTTDELFTNNDSTNIKNFSDIYRNTQQVYSLRLNENKEWEIKFGNGIVGEQLESGDILHIFYLETNGEDGAITIADYSNDSKFQHSYNFLGISKELYQNIFDETSRNYAITSIKNISEQPTVYLSENSTSSTKEESVDDIRNFAPSWFKIGNRLITNYDYVYYLKNRFIGEISDILCQNNYEYVSTFYKWLYSIGKMYHNDGSYYLNSKKLLRNNFEYTDPADFNNVYLWVKLYNGSLTDTLKETFKDDIKKIKSLTTEVVLLNPINVNFAICASTTETAKSYFSTSDIFDENNESYIEIIISDDSMYVAAQVQSLVESVIIDYFDSKKLSLGMVVNYNEIYNNILKISGIDSVRTIWASKEDINMENPRIFDGLCFATWSDSYLDTGDDMDVSNLNKTLQPFQYPILYNNSIKDKIKVIKKSVINTNKMKY